MLHIPTYLIQKIHTVFVVLFDLILKRPESVLLTLETDSDFRVSDVTDLFLFIFPGNFVDCTSNLALRKLQVYF